VSARAKGLLLTGTGVVLISPDSLLIRLLSVDHWTILFWRGLFSAVGLTAIVGLRSGTTLGRRFGSIGRGGLIVTILSGGANLLFVLAITHTSVAKVLVILSASPLLAALLSRIVFGDHVSKPTWIASLVVMAAIAFILSSDLAAGGMLGNLMAVGAVLFLSASLTVVRAQRSIDMTPALALSGVIGASVAVCFASSLAIGRVDLIILLGAGLVMLPTALALLMQGPRYISAPEVALVLLLETLLGPLWVWLVLEEAPSPETLQSGVVIVAALAGHTLAQLRNGAMGQDLQNAEV
jgi:drug/metabolite transporter (DMT)-like permease